MKIKTRSWTTPNFVLGDVSNKPGATPEVSLHLQEADVETLSELCDRYRAEVFRKAGKPDPKATP